MGVAAGQQGQAEAWRDPDESAVRQATSRARRRGEGAGAPILVDGPAFISDEAEEQHYLDTIADERTEPEARATTRMELARLYERRQRFLDAAELYERNVWAGVRTPATYARLVAAYRALGRDDLAEAALEQIRRNGGAGRASGDGPAGRGRQAAPRGARVMAARLHGLVRPPTSVAPAASARAAVQTTRRLAEPFLTGQAGRRTRLISTVILPIALGLLIVGVLVMMS